MITICYIVGYFVNDIIDFIELITGLFLTSIGIAIPYIVYTYYVWRKRSLIERVYLIVECIIGFSVFIFTSYYGIFGYLNNN